MLHTFSWMEKIRAELAWVTETPDPNKWGCRNLVAARNRDTAQELAAVLSPRSSGRSGGSTTASPAVNTDGAEVNLAVHDSGLIQKLSALVGSARIEFLTSMYFSGSNSSLIT